MRTYIFRPVKDGRYPCVILYSEIFQATAPICRTAAWLAGQGFIVAVPEVYHEFLEPGKVLAYDQAGADEGNRLKFTKTLSSYDSDAKTLVSFLKHYPHSNGKVGVMGICLGGHLSFRAALICQEVASCVCFYPTDLHTNTLGLGKSDDTLQRIGETKAELMLVFGRQDPHISLEGRRKIQQTLEDQDVLYSWHEFNGQHAFLRDEGHRYDSELASLCQQLTQSFLKRTLY